MGMRWCWILVVGLGVLGLGLETPVLVGEERGQAIAADSSDATETVQMQAQGSQIRLNGKTLRGKWAQWTVNGETHFGIESMTLEKTLGVGLVGTEDLSSQPVSWFSDVLQYLPIRFVNPYRYLDISELGRSQGWQLEAANGDILSLETTAAVVQDIRRSSQDWGDRIVVDLDRPLLWRQSTATTFVLQGTVPDALTEKLKTAQLPFKITRSARETELTFTSKIVPQVEFSSLDNPPRLVIDVRGDRHEYRKIQWLDGLLWQQENFLLGSKSNRSVTVTWLEIDPTQAEFKLTPIVPVAGTVVGTGSMVSQAETNQAIAAINAGFFNRNNQYPLGAIRRDNTWLSGAILNRGAVAWDNLGNWNFDRLSFREDFVASNGERMSVELLNSGYVKAGVARYTPSWGRSYTTLVDNEVVLTVMTEAGKDDRIVKQEFAGKTGGDRYSIPAGGYLLVFRSFRTGATKFSVDTTLKRTESIMPAAFATMPQVMGGGPLLVKNGQVVLDGKAEQFGTAFNIQSASRSAIARTVDNKIILATLHGAAAETSGATLREWADLLLKLGATDALNLDGGGSSALVVGGTLGDRHPSTVGRVNNSIGLFLEE